MYNSLTICRAGDAGNIPAPDLSIGGAQVPAAYLKTCPVCGQSFRCYPSRPQETCSRACAFSLRRGPSARANTKACVVCGAAFRCPPSAATITCSPSCSSLHRRKGQPYEQFTCPVCGKTELRKPSRKGRPYCSQACYAKALRTGIQPREPMKRRASRANNLAWKRGRPRNESISAEEWAALLDYYGNVCAYCNNPADLVVEHVIPLALDGPHAIENIVPSCHACNASKRNKTLPTWLLFKRRNSEALLKGES